MFPRAARALALAAAAASLAATAASAGLPIARFAVFPTRVAQGSVARISVATSAPTVCSLQVLYANGAVQSLSAASRAGRASFALHVAASAPSGTARAAAFCAHSGSVTRSFLVVAPKTAAAARIGGGVRFTTFPSRAVQGETVRLGVASGRAAACSLQVLFGNGAVQRLVSPARAGVAGFSLALAKTAATGTARAVVSCGRAGSASRSFLVVGSIVPPRIDVAKQGFSLRGGIAGMPPQISYGIVLANESKTEDAVGVTLLVNFVDASNRLVGTATGTVQAIDAGGSYAYGSSASFPAATLVSRLEIVVQVSSHVPANQKRPAVANVRLVPALDQPAWLGSVEGELVNDDPGVVLQSASVSTVVLDAAGNVLGGGSGTVFGSVPSGAREFFKATSGLGAIPAAQAAQALVSVTPTYRAVA